MAKPSLKITSNFSFQKLSSNLNAVIKDSNLDISTSIAKNTKKNILDGVSPALRPSTLRQRREGKTSKQWKDGGHNPVETPSETRPLYYSKRLFNSIKGTKEGLEIMDYAFEHQRGFRTSSGKNVPPRPFIATIDEDKDALKKVNDRIVNRINRTMLKTSR